MNQLTNNEPISNAVGLVNLQRILFGRENVWRTAVGCGWLHLNEKSNDKLLGHFNFN